MSGPLPAPQNGPEVEREIRPETAPAGPARGGRAGTGGDADMSPLPFALFLLALAAGAWLRFFDLPRRPLHHDEGVNALFLLDLVRNGKYHYDPSNYHGPLLYYMVAPLLKLLGESTVLLRLWPAILGTATLAVYWPLRRFIGDWGAVGAAWLLALSPISVYFSRDAIHESWFVAASALLFGAAAAWATHRRGGYVLLAWFASALMIATKETAPLVFFAFACALLAALFLAGGKGQLRAALREMAAILPQHAWGVMVATALLVLLFTSFLTHFQGFLDLFKAYAIWTKTGTRGAGHEKAWPYFIEILWRYERLAWVLGVGGTLLALLRREAAIAVGIAGLALLSLHSLVPYKTPWCVLGIIPWMAGSAGYLLDRALQATPRRWLKGAAFLAFAAGLVPLGRTAWRLSFVDYDDDHESVVYSQTRREHLGLVRAILAAAGHGPEGRGTPVDVMSSDHFPLNWYLRDMSQVAYWGDRRTPRPGALIVIPAGDLEGFRNTLDSEHFSHPFPLRPGVELALLIPKQLFEPAKAEIPDAGRYTSALPSALLPALEATSLSRSEPGLVARGFAGAHFSRKPVWSRPGWPVRIQFDHGENHDWTPPFGIEWTGYLEAPVAGAYRFSLESDDGSNLEIDGHLVVENWGEHAVRRRDGNIQLLPGLHQVRLLYTDFGGGARLRWRWTMPGGEETIVPDKQLVHAPGEPEAGLAEAEASR